MSESDINAEIKFGAEFLKNYFHLCAVNAGWWTAERMNNPLAFSNALMLIVSECAEAMEGDRKSCADDHIPTRPMREVELADALIRIFDLAGAFNLDIGGALAEKLQYNVNRLDHKPENRAKAGGKAY